MSKSMLIRGNEFHVLPSINIDFAWEGRGAEPTVLELLGCAAELYAYET